VAPRENRTHRPRFGLYSAQGTVTPLHLVPILAGRKGPVIEPDHCTGRCRCNPQRDTLSGAEGRHYGAECGAIVFRHRPWITTLRVPDALPEEL